jgi:GT2 family glycosyltransferase
MTRPVSIILPSLGLTDLLARNLPPLLAELDRRSVGDQVLVVDDTGCDQLSAWLAEHFPSVEVVVRESNGGFARALRAGVEQARHDLFFSMNTDVHVRSGFLDPLVAGMDDEEVVAVVPRVLLDGEEERIESLTGFGIRDARAYCRIIGLDPEDTRIPTQSAPVAFAVGGTCLLRTERFRERGGFDPLFEPFYFEDIDHGWCAWRDGGKVLFEPSSVVEHHHRGTIGTLLPSPVFRAAQEKNAILFFWKHVEDPALLREHLEELHRSALEAWLNDEPDELVWLNLAIDQLDEAIEARTGRESARRSWTEILEASRLDRR